MTNPFPSRPWAPHLTADGSITFLSPEFGEHFHSLQGAWDEALVKYVGPTQLIQRAQSQQQIRILDVCYGLGYNTAAALTVIWSVAPHCQVQLLGLELDQSVAIAALPNLIAKLQAIQGTTLAPTAIDPQQSSPVHLTCDAVKKTSHVLRELALQGASDTSNFKGTLRWGDARQTLTSTPTFSADAIFLDPFSPPQCPQLWSVEFISALAKNLEEQGFLATYSCAAAVRTALKLAGLVIGASPPFGRRWPGTIAAYPHRSSISALPPLSVQETEHLQTRAAVPYRDRTGHETQKVILERRSHEQQQSPLEPTSRWKRRWFGNCRATHR